LGALGATGLLAFVWPAAARFAGSPAWALSHLLAVVAVISFAVVLLVRHLADSRGTDEAMRAKLVLAALMLATVLGTTELLADVGLDVPRGGNLGALAAVSILAIVALRFRLLEDEVSSSAALYSAAIGAFAVIAYLGLFYFLATSAALLVLGTVTITLALAAAMRQLTSAVARRRARLERLALLGRFSAQMAHDLKNPLAALKGAVQFLEVERSRGHSLDDHADFLELVADQIARIQSVVEHYQRLGRVEAELASIDLNEIVESVVEPQAIAADRRVRVKTELARGLPELPADRALLCGALENLVRNAIEAMPEGGTVIVRTAPGNGMPGTPWVTLSVEDTGDGMDARVAERAFDDFYTTKAQGSGLGLAFVRRVAEAHGGRVELSTHVGRGTTVRLELPSSQRAAS
jgi:signal transduction histidine kinase